MESKTPNCVIREESWFGLQTSEKPASSTAVTGTGLRELFENNRIWVSEVNARDAKFFQRLSHQQNPRYLWIGCSDSRVPANEIVGLAPGELFVHRNVANIISLTDVNCLSVLHYAVNILRVRHIIVTGHYGCGGIRTAMSGRCRGPIDNWLHSIRLLESRFAEELMPLGVVERENRLCELNVAEQVRNVCDTLCVLDAWASGEELTVHGLVYDIRDGLLKDLGISVDSPLLAKELCFG